jgi:hypothetical protein
MMRNLVKEREDYETDKVLVAGTAIRAYPWIAAGMAIIPLSGWYMLGERVDLPLLLGIALIPQG